MLLLNKHVLNKCLVFSNNVCELFLQSQFSGTQSPAATKQRTVLIVFKLEWLIIRWSPSRNCFLDYLIQWLNNIVKNLHISQVLYIFIIPSTWETETGECFELEASVGYIVSSQRAWAT